MLPIIMGSIIPDNFVPSIIDGNGTQSFIGISRCRIKTDGRGITTLVGFSGCPLECKYCINPECHDTKHENKYSVEQLYELLKVDDLYFRATGGGVMFGGGEPGLYPDFITQFKNICGNDWKIGIETSLNFPLENLQKLIPVIDEFIIDIKDLDPKIYLYYTSTSIKKVITNLEYLAKNVDVDKVIIRVPLIPQFNTEEDRQRSIAQLKKMGYVNFETFEYKTEIPQKVLTQSHNSDKLNYGKAVCELLKQIRKEIAEANNIDIDLADCPNMQCATGHCPKCDQEAEYIMSKIKELKEIGKPIKI